MEQLPILQHTYDLIKWYVPLLNRLPRSHKFNLGDRLIARLGDRNWKFGAIGEALGAIAIGNRGRSRGIEGAGYAPLQVLVIILHLLMGRSIR
jgi:hypothetical protein